MQVHQGDLTVYMEATDQFDTVYHANDLKVFKRCRTEWLKAILCAKSLVKVICLDKNNNLYAFNRLSNWSHV